MPSAQSTTSSSPRSQQGLTISRLASVAGVSVETVRYYQRRGLMRKPPRPLNRIRHYLNADADRLKFIRRAQGMGFALEEVRSLLDLHTGHSCPATRALAAEKLRSIDDHIRELQALRVELATLVAACDRNTDLSACPVMERLTR